MKDREIRSSMESHISHYVADYFGSRPKGFSRKRIEKYIKLQEYKANGINIMDLYLQSYNKTKEDIITGNIDVKEDSYFNISIPYDKGFKILLDNKQIEYEKTNKNFIGFPISKGKHSITIEYNAPYKNISIIISITSLIALIITNKIYKKNFRKESTK